MEFRRAGALEVRPTQSLESGGECGDQLNEARGARWWDQMRNMSKSFEEFCNETETRQQQQEKSQEDMQNDRDAAQRLLKIYIDHLDRDHRPLQLCGVTINQQFLARIYTLLLSFACTGAVHLAAKIIFGVSETTGAAGATPGQPP